MRGLTFNRVDCEDDPDWGQNGGRSKQAQGDHYPPTLGRGRAPHNCMWSKT